MSQKMVSTLVPNVQKLTFRNVAYFDIVNMNVVEPEDSRVLIVMWNSNTEVTWNITRYQEIVIEEMNLQMSSRIKIHKRLGVLYLGKILMSFMWTNII